VARAVDLNLAAEQTGKKRKNRYSAGVSGSLEVVTGPQESGWPARIETYIQAVVSKQRLPKLTLVARFWVWRSKRRETFLGGK